MNLVRSESEEQKATADAAEGISLRQNAAEEGSDVEVAKEPDPPQPGKKIFLSHCNSYEGRAMFKELWNKDEF